MSKHIIDDASLAVLKRSRIDGKNLYLPEQLDRKRYENVNKALVLLGGKWNRSAKAHVFEDDAEDVVVSAVMTGEVVDRKKLFQFFPTPPELARRIVEMACIQNGDLVLEPSAGRGAILDALDPVKHNVATPEAVHYCELDPKNRAYLAQNYPDYLLVSNDFMLMPHNGTQYNVIIANPPFRGGQDVKHVLHMCGMLRKGGRLVTVMSPGFLYRDDKLHQTFRKEVEDLNMHYEELPEGTFKESGTNIRTVLLKWSRP
jgi:phospholipid N-methyltransferase